MRIWFCLAASFALGLVHPSVGAAGPIYNVADDFSIASNPNGVWTYGYSVTLGGSLIGYLDNGTLSGGLEYWRNDLLLGAPVVAHNPTGAAIVLGTPVYGPGQAGFHPGPNGEYSIFRFTAPSSGQYQLTSSFMGIDRHGTTTDIHVLVNDAPIFSGSVTGFGPGTGPSFNTTQTLQVGDRLDFAVGFGNGNFFHDSTGIDAQLEFSPTTAVPEPASVTLLACMGIARWLSRRAGRSHRSTQHGRRRLLIEILEDRLAPSGSGYSGFGPVTQDPADLSADWASSGHDWSNTGYNAAERAISATNVANLEVSWQHGPASVVGTPIISEGVVYLADSFGVVFAKNAATGAPIWANDVSNAADPLFGASFQAAPVVTQDAVFVADSDAFVYRLNRRTGALEWRTRVDDNPNALIQSDPIVFEGQVLVGVASHENEEPGADPTDNFTLRGSIVALGARSGAIVWKTFTTSDQTLEHPKFGAGVGVWSSPAIDPHTERLFIGTGNYYEPGSDHPSPPSRRDQDLSDSLLSLSTKNGKVKDHRQFTANDVWGHAFPDGPDFDVGAPPNLFSIPSGRGKKMRDVVGVGDKEGTYYVMDRETLKVIWSRKISHGGLIGGIQSTAAVGNGVVYVASHEFVHPVTGVASSIDVLIPRDQAAVWLNSPEGGFVLQNLCTTNVTALDAATGETIWSREIPGGATFAPLILTNGAGAGVTDDVLFMADAGGRLRALDAANDGVDLLPGPGFIQLTLPFPNPGDPAGPPIQVGQFITALSVAHGRLYVSHGIPVEGLNPGGVTVFALPSLAAAGVSFSRNDSTLPASGLAKSPATTRPEIAMLAFDIPGKAADGWKRIDHAEPMRTAHPAGNTARHDDTQLPFRRADLVGRTTAASDQGQQEAAARLRDGTGIAAWLHGLDTDLLGGFGTAP